MGSMNQLVNAMAPYPYPKVYGVEEETGLQVDLGDGWVDPNHLAANLRDYIPGDIAFAGIYGLFLQNGGLLYAGGARGCKDFDNVERATPECASPEEAAVYVQANERLMVEISKTYAARMAEETGRPINVRIQRRVVDSHGNRKGCHDNFSAVSPLELAHEPKRSGIIGHLATRSFVTGAGHVMSSGYRFAQKVNGLQDVLGYDYDGYMYRTIDNHEGIYHDSTGDRLEVRCSDINISPWAITMRLGSMGLLLASLETPLAKNIRDISPAGDPIRLAKECNVLPMGHDGTIHPTFHTYLAVDFQERLADMFLDDLQLYTDLPIEYYKIAAELKRYCEDYRRVIANDAPMAALADRSDMAAKFSRILAGNATRHPRKRQQDYMLRARDDLLYDYIGISADVHGGVTQTNGYGYKLRDRGDFAQTVPQAQVDTAYLFPPKSTRASIRGRLIKDYETVHADWNKVELRGQDKQVIVPTEHLLQNKLDEKTRYELARHAVLREA
jgi:proteasome accessory factor A